VTTPSWDDAYTGRVPAPWDIGQPQPAFVRLARQGLLTGRLLDAGWTIVAIQADTFEVNRGFFDSTTTQAWLATISRSHPG